MSGPTASVLHYTRLSRIIASLACRLWEFPWSFTSPTSGLFFRTGILAEAQLMFRTLCRSIGVALKSGKADAGNAITFLD